MVANAVFFTIFSLVAIISGLVMITRKHPLSAAISLVVTFISLAGLYALLSAKLVFIIQILVYAGAIMTLIIFSIMLLNVHAEDLPQESNISGKALLTLLFLTPVIFVIFRAVKQIPLVDFPVIDPDFGTVKSVGIFLFKNYTFPFEIVSVLLLVSLLGVVVLAKRRI
jgi:NADH-quinone oxidoreductase subunit J